MKTNLMFHETMDDIVFEHRNKSYGAFMLRKLYASLAGILKSGDHILVSRSVFGSTHQILTQIFPRVGIQFTYADIAKPEDWEALIQKNTRMVFI